MGDRRVLTTKISFRRNWKCQVERLIGARYDDSRRDQEVCDACRTANAFSRTTALASDLQATASALTVLAQQRRRWPALARTAPHCPAMRRLPNQELVQPGSGHPRGSRPPKTERQPHAQ